MIIYNLLFRILIGSILNCSIFGINPKICKYCKFFIKKYDSSIEFSKCSFFEKIKPESEYLKKKKNINFLVTGDKIEEIITKEFFYCSTARESIAMCGIEGKKYEPNI